MGASSDPITLAGAMIDTIMSVKLVLKVRQLSKKRCSGLSSSGAFQVQEQESGGGRGETFETMFSSFILYLNKYVLASTRCGL